MKKKRLIILSVSLVCSLSLLWFIYVSVFHHYDTVRINIVDENPFGPVFILDKPYLDKLFNDKMDVKWVYVEQYRGASTDNSDTVWGIRSTSLHGNEINAIRYGELPEGFYQRTPSKGLVVGETYLTIVRTSSGLGYIIFKIIEDGGDAKIVILEN